MPNDLSIHVYSKMSTTCDQESVPLMENFHDVEKRSSLDEITQDLEIGAPIFSQYDRANENQSEKFSIHRTYTSLKIKKAICTIVLFLLPSFLIRRNPSEGTSRPEGPGHTRYETTYLDGLRGVAAFLVVCHHWLGGRLPLQHGWTDTEEHSFFHIFRLPFLRLGVSGSGMVSIFFVISGFALSYKPLRLILEKQDHQLLNTLASSIFRRPFRLYIPIIVFTFAETLYLWFWWTPFLMPIRQGTLALQVWQWYISMLDLTNPFRQIDVRAVYNPPVNGPLWTIPFEFRGSMVIFTTLLLFSKTKTGTRIFLLFAIVIYAFYSYHWDIFLFLSGCLIADLHFLRSKYFDSHSAISSASSHHDQELLPISESLRLATGHKFTLAIRQLRTYLATRIFATRLFTILTFLLLLHILQWPQYDYATSYGYATLTTYTPTSWASIPDLGWSSGTERFWLSISSVLLVFLIDCSPLLQIPFTTSFAQYLGNISYAIYIIHLPVICTLGWWFRALPCWTEWGYWWGFWVELVVVGGVIFWGADLFWRGVDRNAVRCAGWIYGRCRVK